jgi:hypothetical protein
VLLTRPPLPLRGARLACVRPAASVRSEPGSNSQVQLIADKAIKPTSIRLTLPLFNLLFTILFVRILKPLPQDNKRSLPHYPKAYRSLIRSKSKIPQKAPQIPTAHNLKKENKNRSKSKSNDLELLRCPHPPSRYIINVKLQPLDGK